MTLSQSKRILIGLLLPLSMTLAGQKQANHWHFGDGLSLEFSSGSPVLTTPSSMFTQEGCTSLSDTDGNLLFYTNGGGRPAATGTNTGSIWNRNHDLMYDMEGDQGGGFSARQSAIAFPVPGQPQQYYLFTMEETEFDFGGTPPDQPEGRGLSYFIIDMSLNAGLGGVTLADQRVYTPAFEGLTAVAMTGQEGYWVIAHTNQVQLIVVPVTTAGVGDPVLHVVEGQGNFEGQIKANPNGTYLFCNRRLVRFDPVTGTPFAESATLLTDINPLTTEFTPDSRYLYSVATNNPGRRLVRFDLQSGDIVTSQSTLFVFNDAGFTYQMQMAPNGSLYFLEEDLSTDLQGVSEISCPATDQPSVNRFVITLEDQVFFVGLPNYPADIFSNLASTEDTLRIFNDSFLVCSATELELTTINRGVSYQWSNGGVDSVNFVTEPGTYSVTITGGCQPTIEQFRLDNVPALSANIEVLSDTSILCAGQDSIRLSFNPNQAFETANWRILGPDELTFTIDTITFPVVDGGQTIVLSVMNECETFRDTFSYANDIFSASLSDDAPERLCPEESVSLFIDGNIIAEVQWEDGSNGLTRFITTVDSSVEYSGLVISSCGDSLMLVAALDYSRCPIECDATFPNLISPNRDGLNDAFRIFSNCQPVEFNLRIFNRWGQVVHDTSDPQSSWDGTFNNEVQPMDVYFYRAQYRFPDNPEVFNADGQFSLIR